MPNFQEALEKYLKDIKQTLSTEEANEHSYRTPLENFLNTIKPKEIKVIHEPKAKKGERHIRPDFKIYRQIDKGDKSNELSYNSLVGFIECKDYGSNLQKIVKGKQIDKYLEVSPNILLTDYKDFYLLSYSKIVASFSLEDDLFDRVEDKIDEIRELFLLFFNDSKSTIKNKSELVRVLSTQSFYLAKQINQAYQQKEYHDFNSFFERTLDTFSSLQGIALTHEDFCDTLGQSIVYGIFVAYLENNNLDIDKIPAENFMSLLPHIYKTLTEFIYFSIPSYAIPQEVLYVLENIKKTIALIDKAELCKILNQEIEIISIYLYEDFLRSYDSLRSTEKRKEGGVFYTPSPIVEMIVNSLHQILKEKFNYPKGFAQKGVKVLDFATGTGSFLAKVFECIIREEKSKVFKIQNIKDKFFEDIYGFEISFVPYIVAHIKLSSILKKEGLNNLDEKSLKIFLTNTLDLSDIQSLDLKMPLVNLTEEWKEAEKVKSGKKNVLVILGNPPYNNKSKNTNNKIQELLKAYKEGLKETKINLDDDYIKFIRFAQWNLLEERSDLFENRGGLMGFITNNSYLYGRTHRKMRESLYHSFDEIYILNLHGNQKENSKDKNVFDIQVGVCISIFVKYPETSLPTQAKVWYYSTQDNQIYSKQEKFSLLNEISTQGLKCLNWSKLQVSDPYFWFSPRKLENEEYENFWAIADNKAMSEANTIFRVFSSGIESQNDPIVFRNNTKQIQEVIDDFRTLDIQDLKIKYPLKNNKEKRDWSYENAKNSIVGNQGGIQKISLRPFSTCYTFLSKKKGFIAFPRYEIMQHLVNNENYSICFPKQCLNPVFDYGFISSNVPDRGFGGKNSGSETCIAPLYLYNTMDQHEKEVNFTHTFQKYCSSHNLLSQKTPKQILSYIYATLYNPTYREQYLEYLKIGFPRINFEVSQDFFQQFEQLGKELIDLHLLQTVPCDTSIDLAFMPNANTQNPSLTIQALSEAKRYENEKIIINQDLCIMGIRQEIWDFTIGGYRVLSQWFKYRKNYECTQEELEYICNVCKVIKRTLEIMQELKSIPISS